MPTIIRKHNNTSDVREIGVRRNRESHIVTVGNNAQETISNGCHCEQGHCHTTERYFCLVM